VAAAGLLFVAASALSQDIGPATDYEWELLTPDRTMFRDRTLIGNVPLAQEGARKTLLGRSKGKTGRALAVYTDMAFVPGDTVRHFGADLVLTAKDEPLALAILDPDELTPFQEALRYLATTAENIRHSERTDTQIFFRGKNEWKILFTQRGTEQRIEFHFPAVAPYEEQRQELQISHVSALADLIDMALLNLQRQGAVIPKRR
jgi:hypothetical protein